ncbi:amidase [Lachnobacterium bovis]|uniref:amidase n=1 Tax=Lachnobacterium bovis TaxID=140626 RepID=UPI0003B529FB|nr:amidase [Lachnobacterium bovis]
MKLIVIDIQKGITDERLYDFAGFLKNVTSIIDASVKSAFERGYRVIIPRGTNSTMDNDYMDGETTYQYYNEMMWLKRFVDCISLEEAIERMEK